MDVLGIERRNERLVETGEDVVNDLVTLVPSAAECGLRRGPGASSVLGRVHQKFGCLHNQAYLIYEGSEELFLAW